MIIIIYMQVRKYANSENDQKPFHTLLLCYLQ